MEYGYKAPENFSSEDFMARCSLRGRLGLESYWITKKLEGQDDMPIARQFSLRDLELNKEAKLAVSHVIPEQEMLPIDFSE